MIEKGHMRGTMMNRNAQVPDQWIHDTDAFSAHEMMGVT